MTKRMLIDAAHADETRVALLDDDQVYDYDFVSTSKTQIKGNIYLAKITRVEPSLQAAFVEYGGGKQGFLPFSEIHPDYYQLPQSDKQKLLEEQIAEAEAEEAAEEAAFEREQAAREARRNRGDASASEEEEDEFAREEETLRAQESAEPAANEEPVVALALESAAAVSEEPLVASQPLEISPMVTYSDLVSDSAEPLIDEPIADISDSLEVSAESEEAASGEEDSDGRPARSGRDQSLRRRYRIQEVIKRNQIVLVQAIKEERGNKGASLTTFISLAGRAAVLMPNSPKGGGISRKITDRETRKRLKEVAAEMRTHRGMSVIIRTAGIDRTKDEIRRDFEYLVTVWNSVRETTLASTAPALIYEEGNLIKRSLRDLYTSDVSEVMVEGEAAFHEARDFMGMLMPNHVDRVRHYTGTMPLFSSAGVEDQLTAMSEPQVRLPSGGYLVIHPTEALISIDVNSGRSTTERNVEETALKTNLEAAYEVARQLRLRDLAGLVVVDFIDMSYGKNRKHVERAMRDALKADRAKIQVGRISMFGLLELSRQRLRPSISESMGVICPHCKGTGYIHSVETVGIQIIRTLEKEAATGEYTALRVTTHPEAALYLLNEKRAAIQALEQRYGVTVTILMDTALITGNYRLIKVTAEGKEVLHDPALQGQRRRRGRRGGRGREDSGNVIAFAQNAADIEEMDTETAEPRSDDSEQRERSDRPRRERGGRNRNRNRNRDRDRTPRDAQNVPEGQPTEGTEGSVTESAAEGTDENGAPRDRNNRRRGRRGGRNRNRERTPRENQGEAENNESSQTYDATPATPYETPVVREVAAAKPSVIPLSEAQTNPLAVASPIVSESTGTDDKNKRKGWWSRVLEN